ncbi:hypothetical protein DFJ73DRAFT_166635 [Zopfochytrium polystomum]|nr:hypothetical protein DFJ73DRAFT_166635 [Zopfochytrium polystomum]
MSVRPERGRPFQMPQRKLMPSSVTSKHRVIRRSKIPMHWMGNSRCQVAQMGRSPRWGFLGAVHALAVLQNNLSPRVSRSLQREFQKYPQLHRGNSFPHIVRASPKCAGKRPAIRRCSSLHDSRRCTELSRGFFGNVQMNPQTRPGGHCRCRNRQERAIGIMMGRFLHR